jgi:hypothetical protein
VHSLIASGSGARGPDRFASARQNNHGDPNEEAVCEQSG